MVLSVFWGLRFGGFHIDISSWDTPCRHYWGVFGSGDDDSMSFLSRLRLSVSNAEPLGVVPLGVSRIMGLSASLGWLRTAAKPELMSVLWVVDMPMVPSPIWA